MGATIVRFVEIVSAPHSSIPELSDEIKAINLEAAHGSTELLRLPINQAAAKMNVSSRKFERRFLIFHVSLVLLYNGMQ